MVTWKYPQDFWINNIDSISAFMNSVNTLIIVLDQNGLVVYVNKQCENILKSSLSEAIGGYLWELFSTGEEELNLFKVAFTNSMAGSSQVCYKTNLVTKCSVQRLISWSNTILDADNMRKHVVITGIDITQQEKTEDALRKSEEWFQVALKGSDIAVFNQDRYLRYTWIGNPLPTLSPAEVIGRTDAELFPEDYASLARIKLKVMESGIGTSGEELWLKIKDDLCCYSFSIEPLRDQAGRIAGITCAATNITKRKLAEQELQKHRDHLDELVKEQTSKLNKINESLQQEIEQCRLAEKKVRLNESRLNSLLKLDQMKRLPLDDILRVALDEAVRLTKSEMGFLAFLDDNESPMNMCTYSQGVATICSVAEKGAYGLWVEAVHQQGPVVINNYNLPNPLKMVYPAGHAPLLCYLGIPVFSECRAVMTAGVANNKDNYDQTDIDQLSLFLKGLWWIIESKQTEDALRESEGRYRRIVETATEGIWSFDQELKTTLVNPKMAEMLGFSQDAIIGKPIFDYVEKSERLTLETMLTQLSQGIRARFDLKCIRQDGTDLWTLVSATPIIDNNGNFAGAFAMISDITERKRAEEVLKTERKRLFALLDELPAYVLLQGRDYQIQYANRYFREQFGNPEGRPCYDILQKRSRPCEQCLPFQVFDTKQPSQWEWKRFDGQVFQVFDYPFYDFDGSLLNLELGINITAIRKAEEERQRLQEKTALAKRLASLATISAGVAHELCQPLNALKVTADALLYLYEAGRPPQVDKIINNLQRISSQAERIDNIIKHLRTLAKPGQVQVQESCSLNQAVNGALNIVGNQLSTHGIVVIKELSQNLPGVTGNYARLEEVVVNLLANAMDALDWVEKAEKKIFCRTFKSARTVFLEVSDNATGIGTEIKDKIFNPFFTTKEGHGMGLGLPLVQSIITTYGGNIGYYNNVNGGVTFRVNLPAYNKYARI